jgi:SpoVK/Ycf46/Vps4 family AAA+-type ATPase
VDRSKIVAGYVGQTALKTQEVISEALGGVLFIDEAYSLAHGDDDIDFGRESIDTLVKAMEDFREQFIVIVAGYEKPMINFINMNPGLCSRFNKYIKFPDYSPNDLTRIYIQLCEKSQYKLDVSAKKRWLST